MNPLFFYRHYLLNIAEWFGLFLAAIVVFSTYALQVWAASNYPWFVPTSNLEEASYTHIIVRNFLEFGFLNSGFLQDVSSSYKQDDHPYIYNHMPPGHEIIITFLHMMFEGNLTIINPILFSFVPIGFCFYILFIKRLIGHIQIKGAGFIVFFILSWQIMTNTSHPHTSPFLFFLFAPLIFIVQTNRYKVLNKLLVWMLLLVASWILDYVLLSAILSSWILLWATRLWAIRGRDLILVFSAIFLGIFLHLLRNLLYLGPDLFFTELQYVLGNRIFGIPSAEAISGFYKDASILHHGSKPLSVRELLGVVRANFNFSGGVYLLVSLVSGGFLQIAFREGRKKIAVRLSKDQRVKFIFFIRICIWVGGTIITPIILFPAFAQDMSLAGLVHSYFLAIPFLIIFLWSTAIVAKACHPIFIAFFIGQTYIFKRPLYSGILFRAPIFIILIMTLLTGFKIILADRMNEAIMIYRNYISADSKIEFDYLDDLRRQGNGFFMTNINTPVVGFIVRQPGFGVCGLDSVGRNGDILIDKCKISMMKDSSKYLSKHPEYYILFTEKFNSFPGFATCIPGGKSRDPASGLLGGDCYVKLKDRLEINFPIVAVNPRYLIFNLSGKGKKTKDLK